MSVFVAEFSFHEKPELADEMLIQAKSLPQAREFAENHAQTLGIKLFALEPATQDQIRLYRVMQKFICLDASNN